MNFLLTFDCERNWFPDVIENYGFPYSKEPDFSQLEEAMPRILDICDSQNAKITCFVTGEVARNVSLFKSVRHEIAAHTHPCTHMDLSKYPTVEFRKRDALKDYPEEFQKDMIAGDLELITDNLGVKPNSFRAGAMSSGPGTNRALKSLGIGINSSYRYGVNLIGWKPFMEDGIMQVPYYSYVSAKGIYKWSKRLSASGPFKFFNNSIVLLMHPTEFALEEKSYKWLAEMLKTVNRLGMKFLEIGELKESDALKRENTLSTNTAGRCINRIIHAVKRKPLLLKSGLDDMIEYDNLAWNLDHGDADVVLSNEYIGFLKSQDFHSVYAACPINDEPNTGFVCGFYKKLVKGMIKTEAVVGNLFGEAIGGTNLISLEKALNDLENQCRLKGLPRITIYTRQPGLEKLRYEKTTTNTIVIDIDHDDEFLMNRMNQSTRRHIRKALKSPIKITDCSDTQTIQAFHDMRRETMKRSALASENMAFYNDARKLIERSKAKLLTVLTADNNPVAGGLFYFNKDTVYFWKGASLREGWKHRSSDLLHWHLIRWARQKGFRRYNMVGADMSENSDTAGITHFKTGYGGDVIPVNIYTKTLSGNRNTILNLARKIKKHSKRIVR